MRRRLMPAPCLMLAMAGLVCSAALAPTGAAAQGGPPSVQGIVRDASGTPVPGAEVIIGGRTTTTSSEGRFAVDGLAPGPYALVIRKVGFAPVRAQVRVVARQTIELEYQMTEEAARLPTVVVEVVRPGIYGTVGDRALRALPGVRVQVAGPRGGVALTDSLGRFAFPEANRGQYMVRVTHPAYAEQRMVVELHPGEGKELALQLVPGRSVQTMIADRAVEGLGTRLTFGLSQYRMSADLLARRGSVALCDLPDLRTAASDPRAVLIVNGTDVIPSQGFELRTMLCAWRADEVELVEFGPSICSDVTGTLGAAVGVICMGRGTRNVPRSISGARPIGGGLRLTGGEPYVVVWERR